MNKRPLVVGNWKMELSHKGSVEVFGALQKMIADKTIEADMVVCPSYPALARIAELAKGSPMAIGAQNVHEEERGAYTGSVSVAQIRDFVSWCIVGHSEVRAHDHDSDELIAYKAKLLLSHGIAPIVCIGESKEQFDSGETGNVIVAQIDSLLAVHDRVSLSKMVIAYEPIWAIGTGDLPDPNAIYEVMLMIRKRIAGAFDMELADRMRLLYGGSVKADNVAQYVAGSGADGVLVGGASVHPRDFFEITMNVASSYAR